jgi:hypothetical protein
VAALTMMVGTTRRRLVMPMMMMRTMTMAVL